MHCDSTIENHESGGESGTWEVKEVRGMRIYIHRDDDGKIDYMGNQTVSIAALNRIKRTILEFW